MLSSIVKGKGVQIFLGAILLTQLIACGGGESVGASNELAKSTPAITFAMNVSEEDAPLGSKSDMLDDLVEDSSSSPVSFPNENTMEVKNSALSITSVSEDVPGSTRAAWKTCKITTYVSHPDENVYNFMKMNFVGFKHNAAKMVTFQMGHWRKQKDYKHEHDNAFKNINGTATYDDDKGTITIKSVYRLKDCAFVSKERGSVDRWKSAGKFAAAMATSVATRFGSAATMLYNYGFADPGALVINSISACLGAAAGLAVEAAMEKNKEAVGVYIGYGAASCISSMSTSGPYKPFVAWFKQKVNYEPVLDNVEGAIEIVGEAAGVTLDALEAEEVAALILVAMFALL